MKRQENFLAPFLGKEPVAILGYGNQGRAQALNLRDSGVSVIIGARLEGKSAVLARQDGFNVMGFGEALDRAGLSFFLLPDEETPKIYKEVSSIIMAKKDPKIGFAHGFAFHFGLIEKMSHASYFLMSPKGAGAVLRKQFLAGQTGLSAFLAVEASLKQNSVEERKNLQEMVVAYAKAIGCDEKKLIWTSFKEETEADLFSEQTVLCGGIFALMEMAFETLVEQGFSSEVAFIECCYEAKLILDLWMQSGPLGVSEKISATAFYGGVTRGKRLVTKETKKEMEKILEEIRSGVFAKEWMEEVRAGKPTLRQVKEKLGEGQLEKQFQSFFKPKET